MKRILSCFFLCAFIVSLTVCCRDHVAHAEIPDGHHHQHDHNQHGDDDGDQLKHACKTPSMQALPQISFGKADLKKSSCSEHDSAAAIVSPSLILAENREIRGPPPDWPDASQTYPSILLTTQRFLE